VVITQAGVIVTDPANTGHAAAMRAAIAELTDQPVRYLVYSHQHWDHVLGGGFSRTKARRSLATRTACHIFKQGQMRSW